MREWMGNGYKISRQLLATFKERGRVKGKSRLGHQRVLCSPAE